MSVGTRCANGLNLLNVLYMCKWQKLVQFFKCLESLRLFEVMVGLVLFDSIGKIEKVGAIKKYREVTA